MQAVAKNFFHNLRTVAKNIDEAKTSAVRGYLFDAAARIYQLLPFRMNQSTTAACVAPATTVYLYCCYGRFYNPWPALRNSSTDDCTDVQHSGVSLSSRKNPPVCFGGCVLKQKKHLIKRSTSSNLCPLGASQT